MVAITPVMQATTKRIPTGSSLHISPQARKFVRIVGYCNSSKRDLRCLVRPSVFRALCRRTTSTQKSEFSFSTERINPDLIVQRAYQPTTNSHP